MLEKRKHLPLQEKGKVIAPTVKHDRIQGALPDVLRQKIPMRECPAKGEAVFRLTHIEAEQAVLVGTFCVLHETHILLPLL